MTKHRITPFWQRIPHFFLYALNPEPLALAVVVGLLSLISGSLLVWLVLLLLPMKYAMVSLQYTAAGEFKPPALSLDMLTQNYGLPLKFYAIVVLHIMALISLGKDSPLVAQLLLIVGFLLYPAIIISLAMTEEFAFAISPHNWLRVVSALGWPYLALFGLLYMLGNVQGTVEAMLGLDDFGRLGLAVWFAINSLFTIASLHMMGYVLYQYHEALGMDTPESLREQEEAARSPYDSADVERYMAEGNVAAATRELTDMVERHPEAVEPRRRLYMYLLSTDQETYLERFVPYYVAFLVDGGRASDAARVYRDCLQRGMALLPPRDDLYLPLMREMRRSGMARDALQMANGFHKRYPDSEAIPGVYLEMARILSEDLQKDDTASQALRFVLQKFPAHPLAGEVRQYLSIIAG